MVLPMCQGEVFVPSSVCLFSSLFSVWLGNYGAPYVQSGGFVSSPGFVLVLCFLSSLVIMKLPICQGGGFVSNPVVFFFVVFLFFDFCLAR